MRRIRPSQISDKFYLSYLLRCYLTTLASSPLGVGIQDLAEQAHIPGAVLQKLASLHEAPLEAEQVSAQDFYVLFANIMFRYPTVKFWQGRNGVVFVEL